MSCKTLVTTRTYAVNSALGVWDTDIDPVPRYIKAWADPLYAYTGGIECDADPFTEPAPTLLSEIIPKLKTSQYGVFQNSLFSNSNKFKYKFQVFLKENDILSETITGTSSILNNIPDDFVGYYDFQPIITSTNTTGLTIYRDVVDVVYNPNAANRPKEFSSIGISFDGSSLRVIMLSGNYGDKSVTPTACDYDFQSIVSDPITIAGIVNIELICVNKIYTIKVNDVTIPNTVTGNPVFYNNKTVLGKFTDSIIETRYLYSDLCSIYYEVNEVPTYQTLFENASPSGLTITIPNTLGSNNLVLYNYSLGDIEENSTCCPIYQSVTASNSEIGCCFTPTEEDNIKYKINNWYLNSLGFSSIEYAEMMLKIGKNKEANQKLEKINSVHQFVFYIMSIRNRMVCEGKPYTDFVSDETLNTFVEYFNCRGINIKCPLQIAMIGKFTNCCDQIEASVDCECTDEIPSAIISAPIATLDLINQVNLVENYTGETFYTDDSVTFSCCNGNQLLEVLSTLVNPNNVPVTITPGIPQSDGTFGYSLTYSFGDSVVSDTKEFYVQFRLCDQVILRKHLYRVIDTCVNLESVVPKDDIITVPELDINNNNLFNYYTVSNEIELGDYFCCGGIRSWEIINIDTSRITPSLGLELLQPTLGQIGQDNITYTYRFNGENAVVGTKQRVFITYRICNEFTYTVALDFEVVNNCVPTVDTTMTFPAVPIDFDLSTGSGEYFSEVRVLDYNCCQEDDTFKIQLVNAYAVILANYGITVLFPTVQWQTIQGFTYQVRYRYDKNVYLANKQSLTVPQSLQPRINIIQCSNGATITDIWDFPVDDSCVTANISEGTTQINIDLYNQPRALYSVNATVTMINEACNGLDSPFNYEGVDAASNNAALSYGTTAIGSYIGGIANINLTASPYSVNIGAVNNVNYPVLSQSSNLKIFTVFDPANLVSQTVQILDNFFRSDYDAGSLYNGNFNKELPIPLDIPTQTSVFFLCHIASPLVNVEFTLGGNCVVGGDIRATVYNIGSVPSGGNYVPAVGTGVAKIYDATTTGMIITTSNTTPIGLGVFGPATLITLTVATPGFYWVKVDSLNLFEGDFSIQLSLS